MPYIEGFVAAVPTANRDAANEKMSSDSEAMEMEMAFDSRRMFWGGFQPVLDE